MFDSGIGITEIAIKLGRSERTVVMANELNLYPATHQKRSKEPAFLCKACPFLNEPEECDKHKGWCHV